MLELKPMRRDQFLRQPIKHERIIRVRRMAECQNPFIHPQIFRFTARMSNKNGNP
jgi:hypothetical protein